MSMPAPHAFEARPRFVTAASLFDGHDASINIIRRVLQAAGAEVIHLGHDRSAFEVVVSAVQEDASGIAISSYQGGHDEYFRYILQLLSEQGRPDIPVFGGGGGTITDAEIASLEQAGVARLYSAETGRRLGLEGMVADMIAKSTREVHWETDFARIAPGISTAELARWVTLVEQASSGDSLAEPWLGALRAAVEPHRGRATVLGVTGTGGSGKSSLVDELVRRFLAAYPELRLAVVSVDPTRRRTGGALLGDRIRMNSVFDPRVFMRSLATREADSAVSRSVADVCSTLAAAGYGLIIVETAGVGQSDATVTELADLSMYVMTPEFGAPSQLEKIEMLDHADLVVINKGDKRGAEDAVRHVAKQVQRNRGRFDKPTSEMPVYACIASRFGDQGVNRLFEGLTSRLAEQSPGAWRAEGASIEAPSLTTVVPTSRVRYLSEIAEAIRHYHAAANEASRQLSDADGLRRALRALGAPVPAPVEPADAALPSPAGDIARAYNELIERVDPHARQLVATAARDFEAVSADENVYSVRGREIRVPNHRITQSGTRVPRVAAPGFADWGSVCRWRSLENLPGHFPFTAGVFPYRREGEDPTRMFAGEGGPERTNRRFHFLSRGQSAARLSTAFDSVTLYGRDPSRRLDVWGKIGNSGVSVATLDDAKRLYSGFDLCSPSTSVSMTINGPAPMLMALYCNVAIDQAVEKRLATTGRLEAAKQAVSSSGGTVVYRAPSLPEGHSGLGLALLGADGADFLPPDEYREVVSETLSAIRGTVQADILKEDQAQNTCIFSTEFSLKLMGDIQEFFVANDMRNFYSVSISGYHIAEAGANPITQLAFTLANGLTFVEYYRARGMKVDDFARNLSFFFSNGMDAEYTVLGRVARRIWAIAMRDIYGANERSQQLKYHIQTSGRSLHAQEIDFNDIRTTLQAFYAIADNCNSLHTNAYDEAITTPTEDSVRRALAIQLILNREFGSFMNENTLQGSFFIEALTDAVEAAVLTEFDRITDRGGVLGAMELMYQRSRIQEESMVYEHRKHSGEIPIIGVNTFLAPNPPDGVVEVELARSTESERQAQIEGVAAFQRRNAPRRGEALSRLKSAALSGANMFSELLHTTRVCSLGEITHALFEVGGQYRRSM